MSTYNGDEISSLPTDTNEPVAHMEMNMFQKMFKKTLKEKTDEDDEEEPVASYSLMGELKTTLIATILFLFLSHPKFDELLHYWKLDTFTVYSIKALIFASLFFIVKYKFS